MFRSILGVSLPIALALLSGPAGFALGTTGKLDASDLYIVVGSPRALDSVLAKTDAREIGPYRAPFARMVNTPPDAHALWVAGGYWTFPATTLAELCGVQLDT